ncbi:programmed cell death protein 2 [Plectosphaerella plurivora]|uniref:Programmed cell death protein 2 n=1 Tax=Plectosphaerella plurivora TaxID=936078 RepID=A0A9P8VC89_9PEZI|nr:programmed cell death protein 2 [Plectosphaerella plurivora]
MAPYDSDSEIEDQDFTETNVLLGYASKDADEDTISRLGGVPEWIDSNTPSAALARCNGCKEMMVLLLQLNGELPEKFPGHDRRLFVFSCRKQTCQRKQGSVRAIRGTRVSKEALDAARAAKEAAEAEEKRRKEEASKPKEVGPGLGNALFGGGSSNSTSANPFSSGSANPFGSSSGGNPFSSTPSAQPAKKEDAPKQEDAAAALPKTFAETLNLNNTQKVDQGPPPPPEAWPTADKLPKPYSVSYLDEAEFETLDPEPAPVPQKITMDVDDGEQAGAGGVDKEVFESSMDEVFQKFADRLAQNPDQSIRYEFGGTPLLYSKKDNVGKVLSAAAAAKKSGMPRCGNCGAGRVFEVQLTPQAITELESEEELGLEGMEWGTVIVGVCEADCLPRGTQEGEAGYIEEWCGVQWEELDKK